MTEGGAVHAPEEREALVRRYAAGDVTWHALRERGFEDYVEVLGTLGELGLRPPVASMTGPNLETRAPAQGLRGHL